MCDAYLVSIHYVQVKSGKWIPLRIVFVRVEKEPKTFIVLVDFTEEPFTQKGPLTLEDGMRITKTSAFFTNLPYDDVWKYSELGKKLKKRHDQCLSNDNTSTLIPWTFQEETHKLYLMHGIFSIRFVKEPFDMQTALLVEIARNTHERFENKEVDKQELL